MSNLEETDRARLIELADQVFGNHEKAQLWLSIPDTRFGGETPMDMLATKAGAKLVEEMLIQIDEGAYT